MAMNRLVSPGATPSCRSDYLTCTFKLPDDEMVDDLIAYGHNLGHFVLPGGELKPTRKGKHYSHVFEHDSGVVVEVTPPKSERKNAGTGLISVPGSVFGALDASERVDLITDVRRMEGFYRCTRWDAQLTVLDPPVSVGEFVDDVSAGKYWPKGYSTARPWGEKTLTGEWKRPPTQYFGSTQSQVMVRVYDHGADKDWERESMRFEIQFRKQWADDHFRRLASRCQLERGKEPLLVEQEELTVKQSLQQHFDLRDTSAVNRSEKPSKWLRKAPKVSWYQELVEAPAGTVEKQYRPAADCYRAREVGCEQYGAKQAMTVFHQAVMNNTDLHEQAYYLFLQMCQHLKKDHVEEIYRMCRTADQEHLASLIKEVTEAGAVYGEHFDSEKPLFSPRG